MWGVLINRVHCYGCTVCTLLNPSKIWYGGMVLEHILSNSGLLYLSLAFLGYPTEGLSGIRENFFLNQNSIEHLRCILCVSWPAVSCAALLLQLTKLVAGLYFPDWHVMTFSDIYWEVRGGGGGGGVIIGWACHALLAAVELSTILREVFTITEKVPNRNFSWLKVPRLLKC